MTYARPEGRWTVATAYGRAREVLAREGARNLLLRVLGETVYRRMLVMECSLAEQPPPVLGDADVSFGLLQPADVDDYLEMRPATSREDVEERLRRGDPCFVTRRDGRLVQACWAADSSRVPIEYLRRDFPIADDETMLYDFYAAPDARGHNLYRAQITAMFRHFQGHPRQRILAAFHPENRMWVLFQRVGLRPVGIIGYVGAGPVRVHFSRWNPASAERLRARATRKPRRHRRLVPFASNRGHG